jgi:hypothetical protein
MIKLSSHCGICRFDFTNVNEKSLLEILLNDDINSNGFLVSAPRPTHSLKGQSLNDNIFSLNYEGTTGEILEVNGLTYEIFSKTVVKTDYLKHNPISSDNIILGLMTCNNVVKRFTGVYNLKQNTTEVFSYETY